MTLDEAISKYKNSAEYEKQNGNLQGYMDFKQLADWLEDYQDLLRGIPYVAAKLQKGNTE